MERISCPYCTYTQYKVIGNTYYCNNCLTVFIVNEAGSTKCIKKPTLYRNLIWLFFAIFLLGLNDKLEAQLNIPLSKYGLACMFAICFAEGLHYGVVNIKGAKVNYLDHPYGFLFGMSALVVFIIFILAI